MHLPYRVIISGSNRDRLGGSDHPIQRLDADGHLSHLGLVITGTQVVSDDRFVTAERRLDQRSTAIVGGFLPGYAAEFADHLICRPRSLGPSTLSESVAVRRGGLMIVESSPD